MARDPYQAALFAEKEQAGNVGLPICGARQEMLHDEMCYRAGRRGEMGKYRGDAALEYLQETYRLDFPGVTWQRARERFYDGLGGLIHPVAEVLGDTDEGDRVCTLLNGHEQDVWWETDRFFANWPSIRAEILGAIPAQFHAQIEALDALLPGADAAAASGADEALPPSAPPLVPAPHADLIAAIRGYAQETHHGRAHIDRWYRVLKALGVDDAMTRRYPHPMTAAEARTYADQGWGRWVPVVEALRDLEVRR